MAVGVALLACSGSDGTSAEATSSSGTTTTSSVGGAGGATATGAGGAGGSSTSSTASAGGGGGGGAGGSPCIPNPDPCGADECGEVDDGCGTMLPCGQLCEGSGVCTDDGGTMTCVCTPQTCEAAHGFCQFVDTGCPGLPLLVCDTVCGAGSPLLDCDLTSSICVCTDAPEPEAQAACPGMTSKYCGSPHPDVPATCSPSGQHFQNEEIWCCL